jgi:hypothetical protein
MSSFDIIKTATLDSLVEQIFVYETKFCESVIYDEFLNECITEIASEIILDISRQYLDER